MLSAASRGLPVVGDSNISVLSAASRGLPVVGDSNVSVLSAASRGLPVVGDSNISVVGEPVNDGCVNEVIAAVISAPGWRF